LPRTKEVYTWYRLDEIKKLKAQYNVIYGERSNGKTTSCLEEVLKEYCANGKQGVYIRRWDDDLKPKTAGKLFNFIIQETDWISKYSGGVWNTAVYKNREYYLARDEVNKKGERVQILDKQPFLYCIALTMSEHYKSVSFPKVTTIIFDEFMAKGTTFYLEDEFIVFCNLISTIVRQRNDVTIYMLANSISMYGCPYVYEMGLKHMKTQDKNTIDVYTYGRNKELKVAVEYSDSISPNGKASDVYFAFDNPKLKMITGEGSFAVAQYPHLKDLGVKYKKEDIVLTFFVLFDEEVMQCECVQLDNNVFIYIHRKTTQLQNEDEDLIYSTDYSIRNNWHRNILRPQNAIQRAICNLIATDRVFYQDNMLGECFTSYYKWCKQN